MSIVSEHIHIGLTGPWIVTTGTSRNTFRTWRTCSAFTITDIAGIQFSQTDTLDASLMAAGDMLMITLRRDASDVADDRNGDMAIATVKFIYTSSLTG